MQYSESLYKIDTSFLDEYGRIFIVDANTDVARFIEGANYTKTEAKKIAKKILENYRYNKKNNPFSKLPKDIKHILLYNLDPRTLLNLCVTDRTYKRIYFNNINFWKNYISFRYGKIYVNERPDIVTTEQLIQHASDLENNLIHDITCYGLWNQLFGVIIPGYICTEDNFDPYAEEMYAHEITGPNIQLWHSRDYHGQIRGSPITSFNTIFYACLITSNTNQNYITTSHIFSTPKQCAKYIIKTLLDTIRDEKLYVHVIGTMAGYSTDWEFIETNTEDCMKIIKKSAVKFDNTEREIFSIKIGFENCFTDIFYNHPELNKYDTYYPGSFWRDFEFNWFPVKYGIRNYYYDYWPAVK